MTTNEPPEVPDLTPDLDEELAALTEQRLSRLRHANRIRNMFKISRPIGVDIRNARKLRRNRAEREEQ